MRGIPLVLVLQVLAFSPGASGGVPSRSEESLDEVMIIARLSRLSDMRREIDRLEDRFYARYNRLNAVDDFDVLCRSEAPIGTRLKKRSCRAIYQEAAIRDEGRDGFQIRQNVQDQLANGSSDPVMPGSPPVPALMAIQARVTDFRQNMRDLVSRHAELAQILEERARKIERFNAERRKVFGTQPGLVPEAEEPAALPAR